MLDLVEGDVLTGLIVYNIRITLPSVCLFVFALHANIPDKYQITGPQNGTSDIPIISYSMPCCTVLRYLLGFLVNKMEAIFELPNVLCL